ncbi:tetratricopeptide repeat protein [Calothrix sp. 336/3]|uniref:tetratricopeptide repeat protein n=1 Tax=Calothrix sp. 336/3 TaxID=1337936 RepID=UPI0004E3F1C0|nr:tetratricopeptide repeat protein [Calothrix sp. 336/3]AKG23314.1 hypothetical protein IJ00_20330 [Calothrix sp. 336/3]
MTTSNEDYLAARRHKTERRRKIVTFVSILSFSGSTVFALLPMLQEAVTTSVTSEQEVVKPESESQNLALQRQLRSFEVVLKQEPNNQVALEGLAKVQIQQGNIHKAIAPLEKLVLLYPQRQDYKTALENLKKQVNKQPQQK